MRRAVAQALAVLLSAASLATAGTALGIEEAEAAQGPSPPGAEVVVVGDFPGASAVGARVISWFQGQHIPASASRTSELGTQVVFAPSAAAGVRLWVVLLDATRARLFFAVQQRADDAPRFLVEDVELSGGLDELGLERLAQVGYLSALALWEGNVESSRREVERGLEQPPGPKPATQPRAAASAKPAAPLAPAPPQPRWLGHGIVSLDSQLRGPEGLFLGPLLGGSVGHFDGRDSEWAVALAARLFLTPSSAEAQGVELQLWTLGSRLSVRYARLLTGSWWALGELGPELERVSYEVSVIDNPTLRTARSRGTSWRPGGFGDVALGLKVDRKVMLTLALSVSVPFVRFRYAIKDPQLSGGQEQLLAPWPVEPGLSAGVSVF